MVSQSEAGLAASSIYVWRVGKSGYLLRPWLIHLGNGILQVKRPADAAVWRVPVRCTEPTQHFTHTSDRQKMAQTVIRSSQVPVEICVHYPSERPWKSCELGVLAVKELRAREVKWLAPLPQPSTGSQSSVIGKPTEDKSLWIGSHTSSIPSPRYVGHFPIHILQFPENW